MEASLTGKRPCPGNLCLFHHGHERPGPTVFPGLCSDIHIARRSVTGMEVTSIQIYRALAQMVGLQDIPLSLWGLAT